MSNEREFTVDGELSEEELMGVLGSSSHEVANEKALENSTLYREKMINELREERERLTQGDEYSSSNSRGSK